MARRVHKKITLRKKLHILQAMANSKSLKRISIAIYIYKLKLLLDRVKREYANLIDIRREYLDLMKNLHYPQQVVKIEKVGPAFVVRVNCEKRGDTLVTILEAFEEMGLHVLQARVSCNNVFALEAIAVAEDKTLDVKIVTEALLKAINQKHFTS
ncbi:Transcription factor bHLH35-like protein [Quillaja saponaria]|uniref:Transcription factor bHLH35-like protein n=1 Tax=Quillaja saponaria TaxID=32244 RepID=A0AAD7KWP2_QUISA|nr:Transcription factor bHLH35-like protein [Quillaja saponaria]